MTGLGEMAYVSMPAPIPQTGFLTREKETGLNIAHVTIRIVQGTRQAYILYDDLIMWIFTPVPCSRLFKQGAG